MSFLKFCDFFFINLGPSVDVVLQFFVKNSSSVSVIVPLMILYPVGWITKPYDLP
jgi:hypothetical protein